MDGYEELANAVILQAVKDWRKAVRTIRRHPRYKPAIIMKEDCERFFLSDWFSVLTKVDGSMILQKLKEEENNS